MTASPPRTGWVFEHHSAYCQTCGERIFWRELVRRAAIAPFRLAQRRRARHFYRLCAACACKTWAQRSPWNLH